MRRRGERLVIVQHEFFLDRNRKIAYMSRAYLAI
jgi:hypothetical protein